jgi:hypothetical protein
VDTLAQPSAAVPELTAQQREFVQYLLTITRGGTIAAAAYELGHSEALASLRPAVSARRPRHLVPVS